MVRAIMIVEVAGHPPEHVKESLEKHVGALREFKDVTVHSIKVSDSKEVEKGKNFFTCFAEVDFESESFSRVCEIMFDFMPSSVEVIEPSKVSLDTHQATNLLNNISGRMHRYDQAALLAQGKVRQLMEQLEISNKILLEKGIIQVKDGKLVMAGVGEKNNIENKKTGDKKTESKIVENKKEKIPKKIVKKKVKKNKK